MEQKKPDFSRFWKEQGSNLIAGLVITLVLCILMGIQGLAFSLPVWIALALIFWLLRMWLLYRSWKRNNSD